MTTPIRSLALALGVLLTFGTMQALAQGKGEGKDKGKAKFKTEQLDRDRRPEPELRRRDRDDDRYDDDRYERDRRDARDRRYDSRRKGVPRGWCIGRGNPHNTPENCGYDRDRRDRRDRDDRRYASFEEAHRAYHQQVYDRCVARANERPLDVQRQIRIRTECSRAHEEWHRRNDPTRR